MHECDVLIVGAGPAGSTLAWALRDSGLSVTVMDKATFPRDKVCAGWVTPEVVEALQMDVGAYGRERTIQPITGFRAGLLGSELVETHYKGGPASYGIRRFEFDHYLMQRCGAQMLLGTPFKLMEREGGQWLVNGEVRARLVVGAGGHFCPVARAVGSRVPGAELLVAAQEIEFEMTPEQEANCRVEPHIPELFFTPDLQGYGWAFRKGNFLNIGLGREDSEKISDHVQAFRDYLVRTGRVGDNVPQKFKGHAYLLYHHAVRELTHDGVLLIGDSAGLAYPESGEGIRPAVESALLAATVIEAATGDVGRVNDGHYRELMRARFGERQPPPDLLGRLPMGLKRLASQFLMRNHWFVRNVLVERWFLHRHLPPLFG